MILCWRSLGDGDGVSSTASIATAITRSFQPTGRPLPLGLLRREYIILLEIALSALSLLLCGLQAEPRYIILVPVLAAIWIIGSLTSKAYKAEIQQRREAFNRAKMDYDHLVSQIQQLGGLEGFIAKRTMLEKMKDEMLGLPEEEKTCSGSTSRHCKGTAEAEVSGGIFY